MDGGWLLRRAADAVLLVHAAFIVFAVFGGLLAARRPGWRWVHLPCAAWAAAVVAGGWVCPLTPLEDSLRVAAGQAGHGRSFIEHYLLTLIYPPGLTRGVQWFLAATVIAANLWWYRAVWMPALSRSHSPRVRAHPDRSGRPPASTDRD